MTVLEFANAIAPGDVLRELFSRQLLRAEFVLVTGDVVSNMRFDEVVQAHKYIALSLVCAIRSLDGHYSSLACVV